MIDFLEGYLHIYQAAEMKGCTGSNIRKHILRGKLNGLEISGSFFVKDDENFQKFQVGEKPKERKKYFSPPIEAPKQKCKLTPA